MSPRDNDGAWEEAVSQDLRALLVPEGHGEIGWSHDFEPVKVLDWAGREGELLAHRNPAALFVLAQLKSRQTTGDPGQRAGEAGPARAAAGVGTGCGGDASVESRPEFDVFSAGRGGPINLSRAAPISPTCRGRCDLRAEHGDTNSTRCR